MLGVGTHICSVSPLEWKGGSTGALGLSNASFPTALLGLALGRPRRKVLLMDGRRSGLGGPGVGVLTLGLEQALPLSPNS